jgi:HEPN domain-containing protein
MGPGREGEIRMARKRYTGVSEQAKAGKHRLEDARTLLAAGRWRGAMYLAGYAVECYLKAKLMRTLGCRKLEELEDRLRERGVLAGQATIYTHHLESLMRLAGGIDRLRRNPARWRTFTLANQWIPAWRYSANLSTREDATDFLEAIEDTIHWIDRNL